uniref:Uncharacterized protein n=1 Tax=Oryza glumipatula TaxID=40148 RepID=A0A0D9ZMT1_9ORYZ
MWRRGRGLAAGKEESGCGRAVDGGGMWRRGRGLAAGKEESGCGRAVDGGNKCGRESRAKALPSHLAGWQRRCRLASFLFLEAFIPLSFPYHILRVKTLLRFRMSGGGDPRRILLGGTALEKPLRARILSLVYALASNFSPRP